MVERQHKEIQIFADTANLDVIRNLDADDRIGGLTTNPAIMYHAGVRFYRAFGQKVMQYVRVKPVSLEVLADDPATMELQARELASWGKNVVVKIPVTDTAGKSMSLLISKLVSTGVSVNVTAVFTEEQVVEAGQALNSGTEHAIVSVFAGRIADAGVDPLTHVRKCHAALRKACPRAQMLWASPRQVYDFVLAEKAGCEIITMTPELIAKLSLLGRDLESFSRDTVQQFFYAGEQAGYTL